MTGYKKGKVIGQVTEILMDQRLYTEVEIRAALKAIPAPKKNRKKS